jgi:hypothetical protein
MDIDAIEREADAAAGARNFARARALLTDVTRVAPELFAPWLKLAAMCRATGDASASLAAAENALALQPLDFTALLMRATQLQALGNADRAGEAFGRALAQAPDPAPPQFGPVLAEARARFAAWQTMQAAHLRAAVSGPIAPALDHMIRAAVRQAPPEYDGPTHYCYPGLDRRPFHDRERFAWLADLEAATDAIQREFEAVAAAHAAELVPYIAYPETVPLEQWRALNNNRDWTAIHLLERGREIAANTRHCPQTMALLNTLPQPHIAGAGPNAMFSLLAPGTHIPPHTGIANVRLVCHLPLIVPDGCWFRVGQHRRDWRRGEAWVFDDTIEHEAMNPSEALRVILIVDLWHPDLDQEARGGVAAVIAAGGQVHGL